MDENPFKTPAAMPSEHKRLSALGVAWISFELLAVAVMGVSMLFIPDDTKTPAQKAMAEFGFSIMARGFSLLAALLVPLVIWTWRRLRRG